MGVTNVGKATAARRLYGTADAAYDSIGLGTGTTAFDVTDTALETGKATDGTGDSGVHAVADSTPSNVTTTVADDTAQFVGTAAFTASLAVTESGLFNATTNGTMLCRQVFAAVNVASGDSIQFTWKIKAA